jgi:hypothetical protein
LNKVKIVRTEVNVGGIILHSANRKLTAGKTI